MPTSPALKVFVSYAHKDEDHHRRLTAHLEKLKTDGLISSWDDRAIAAGEQWDKKIKAKLTDAQIIVLLVSKRFLASTYVRQVEIPLAKRRQRDAGATLVCVILDKCEWNEHFARYQVLPPSTTPVTLWPDRDSVYAVIASNIRALVEERQAGIAESVRAERKVRSRTIFQHTPFRIAGEAYDPFRAFQKVFLRNHLYRAATQFPLDQASAQQAEFVGLDYQTIFAMLRDSTQPPGLEYDLICIPYFLLGHCIERNLVQPLDDRLKAFETRFAWWPEMCSYQNRLYGVPLSSLTMLLAVRKDLFEHYDLQTPATWEDYMALIDEAIARRLPVAPAPLHGRDHITLWYDWLNHLYAHDTTDLALYGTSRMAAREAAETLRRGTESYLVLASKLAAQPVRDGVAHWATANWDDGIEAFACGHFLTTLVFNDALDTLRRLMETRQNAFGAPMSVKYLTMPTAKPSNKANGQVEGWILCVPTAARYYEAANDVLEWFLQQPIQEAYARWGGASGDLAVIDQQAKNKRDGGAGRSFKLSVKDSQSGETAINLVKYNGPRALEVIDRIRADLYDAVLAVGCGKVPPGKAAGRLVERVEQRLLARGG